MKPQTFMKRFDIQFIWLITARSAKRDKPDPYPRRLKLQPHLGTGAKLQAEQHGRVTAGPGLPGGDAVHFVACTGSFP